jgi:hypothetical protein
LLNHSYTITSYIFNFESRKAAMNAGEEKALAIIKTFDLTLTGDETDQVLQAFLDKLKNESLEVNEFNIYKLDNDPKVIASVDPAIIGNKTDPEDLVAAKEDRTVSIIEKDIVDVTTPLHSNGKIVFYWRVLRNNK